MINENRIVPVTKTDLISLYGFILNMTDPGIYAKLDPVEIGVFEIPESYTAGALICSEPVKTIDLTNLAEDTWVVFVPAYDFEGVTGATLEESGDEIIPDGVSLYSIGYESSAYTAHKMTV